MTILDKVHICISMVYELEAGFFLSQCKKPSLPESQGNVDLERPL